MTKICPLTKQECNFGCKDNCWVKRVTPVIATEVKKTISRLSRKYSYLPSVPVENQEGLRNLIADEVVNEISKRNRES